MPRSKRPPKQKAASKKRDTDKKQGQSIARGASRQALSLRQAKSSTPLTTPDKTVPSSSATSSQYRFPDGDQPSSSSASYSQQSSEHRTSAVSTATTTTTTTQNTRYGALSAAAVNESESYVDVEEFDSTLSQNYAGRLSDVDDVPEPSSSNDSSLHVRSQASGTGSDDQGPSSAPADSPPPPPPDHLEFVPIRNQPHVLAAMSFDRESRRYAPGECVTGCLSLIIGKTLPRYRISLLYRAMGHVETHMYQKYDPDECMEDDYQESFHLQSDSIDLWPNSDPESQQFIIKGTHRFLFSFRLPDYSPQTHEDDEGRMSIEYRLILETAYFNVNSIYSETLESFTVVPMRTVDIAAQKPVVIETELASTDGSSLIKFSVEINKPVIKSVGERFKVIIHASEMLNKEEKSVKIFPVLVQRISVPDRRLILQRVIVDFYKVVDQETISTQRSYTMTFQFQTPNLLTSSPDLEEFPSRLRVLYLLMIHVWREEANTPTLVIKRHIDVVRPLMMGPLHATCQGELFDVVGDSSDHHCPSMPNANDEIMPTSVNNEMSVHLVVRQEADSTVDNAMEQWVGQIQDTMESAVNQEQNNLLLPKEDENTEQNNLLLSKQQGNTEHNNLLLSKQQVNTGQSNFLLPKEEETAEQDHPTDDASLQAPSCSKSTGTPRDRYKKDVAHKHKKRSRPAVSDTDNEEREERDGVLESFCKPHEYTSLTAPIFIDTARQAVDGGHSEISSFIFKRGQSQAMIQVQLPKKCETTKEDLIFCFNDTGPETLSIPQASAKFIPLLKPAMSSAMPTENLIHVADRNLKQVTSDEESSESKMAINDATPLVQDGPCRIHEGNVEMATKRPQYKDRLIHRLVYPENMTCLDISGKKQTGEDVHVCALRKVSRKYGGEKVDLFSRDTRDSSGSGDWGTSGSKDGNQTQYEMAKCVGCSGENEANSGSNLKREQRETSHVEETEVQRHENEGNKNATLSNVGGDRSKQPREEIELRGLESTKDDLTQDVTHVEAPQDELLSGGSGGNLQQLDVSEDMSEETSLRCGRGDTGRTSLEEPQSPEFNVSSENVTMYDNDMSLEPRESGVVNNGALLTMTSANDNAMDTDGPKNMPVDIVIIDDETVRVDTDAIHEDAESVQVIHDEIGFPQIDSATISNLSEGIEVTMTDMVTTGDEYQRTRIDLAMVHSESKNTVTDLAMLHSESKIPIADLAMVTDKAESVRMDFVTNLGREAESAGTDLTMLSDESDNKEIDLVMIADESESTGINSALDPIESESKVIDSTMAPIESESTGIDSAMAPIESESTGIDSAMATIESESTGIDSTMAPIESESTGIDSAMAPIESESTGIDSAMATIESESTGIDSAMAPIESESTGIDSTMAPIESESTGIDSAMATIESESTGIDSTMAPIESESTGIDSTMTPIESESTGLDPAMATIKSESSDINSTMYTIEPESNKTELLMVTNESESARIDFTLLPHESENTGTRLVMVTNESETTERDLTMLPDESENPEIDLPMVHRVSESTGSYLVMVPDETERTGTDVTMAGSEGAGIDLLFPQECERTGEATAMFMSEGKGMDSVTVPDIPGRTGTDLIMIPDESESTETDSAMLAFEGNGIATKVCESEMPIAPVSTIGPFQHGITEYKQTTETTKALVDASTDDSISRSVDFFSAGKPVEFDEPAKPMGEKHAFNSGNCAKTGNVAECSHDSRQVPGSTLTSAHSGDPRQADPVSPQSEQRAERNSSASTKYAMPTRGSSDEKEMPSTSSESEWLTKETARRSCPSGLQWGLDVTSNASISEEGESFDTKARVNVDASHLKNMVELVRRIRSKSYQSGVSQGRITKIADKLVLKRNESEARDRESTQKEETEKLSNSESTASDHGSVNVQQDDQSDTNDGGEAVVTGTDDVSPVPGDDLVSSQENQQRGKENKTPTTSLPDVLPVEPPTKTKTKRPRIADRFCKPAVIRRRRRSSGNDKDPPTNPRSTGSTNPACGLPSSTMGSSSTCGGNQNSGQNTSQPTEGKAMSLDFGSLDINNNDTTEDRYIEPFHNWKTELNSAAVDTDDTTLHTGHCAEEYDGDEAFEQEHEKEKEATCSKFDLDVNHLPNISNSGSTDILAESCIVFQKEEYIKNEVKHQEYTRDDQMELHNKPIYQPNNPYGCDGAVISGGDDAFNTSCTVINGTRSHAQHANHFPNAVHQDFKLQSNHSKYQEHCGHADITKLNSVPDLNPKCYSQMNQMDRLRMKEQFEGRTHGVNNRISPVLSSNLRENLPLVKSSEKEEKECCLMTHDLFHNWTVAGCNTLGAFSTHSVSPCPKEHISGHMSSGKKTHSECLQYAIDNGQYGELFKDHERFSSLQANPGELKARSRTTPHFQLPGPNREFPVTPEYFDKIFAQHDKHKDEEEAKFNNKLFFEGVTRDGKSTETTMRVKDELPKTEIWDSLKYLINTHPTEEKTHETNTDTTVCHKPRSQNHAKEDTATHTRRSTLSPTDSGHETSNTQSFRGISNTQTFRGTSNTQTLRATSNTQTFLGTSNTQTFHGTSYQQPFLGIYDDDTSSWHQDRTRSDHCALGTHMKGARQDKMHIQYVNAQNGGIVSQLKKRAVMSRQAFHTDEYESLEIKKQRYAQMIDEISSQLAHAWQEGKYDRMKMLKEEVRLINKQLDEIRQGPARNEPKTAAKFDDRRPHQRALLYSHSEARTVATSDNVQQRRTLLCTRDEARKTAFPDHYNNNIPHHKYLRPICQNQKVVPPPQSGRSSMMKNEQDHEAITPHHRQKLPDMPYEDAGHKMDRDIWAQIRRARGGSSRKPSARQPGARGEATKT